MCEVAIESPLELREYELNWHVPTGAIRVCVSAEGDRSAVADVFLRALHSLLTQSDRLVFEVFDCYTPPKKWPVNRNVKNVSMKVFESRNMHGIDCDTIIATTNEALAGTACEAQELRPLLRSIEATGIIVSKWKDANHQSLLFSKWGYSVRRFEQAYVESLSLLDFVAFVSFDHSHLEVVSLDLSVARNITQACGSVS